MRILSIQKSTDPTSFEPAIIMRIAMPLSAVDNELTEDEENTRIGKGIREAFKTMMVEPS